MELTINKTRVVCLTGNLTTEEVDAIVNAANPELTGGGGVDGAIHYAAGPQLDRECRELAARIKRLEPGRAAMTSGGSLKAKHVIHTVGPIWKGGREGEEAVLRRAHKNCLLLAADQGLKSLAFPAISTGAYKYPKLRAALAAVDETAAFLREDTRLELVKFVLFEDDIRRMYEDALKLCGS